MSQKKLMSQEKDDEYCLICKSSPCVCDEDDFQFMEKDDEDEVRSECND